MYYYTFYCIKVGATVDIKCSDKKELVRATIQKIQDCSQYTVGMYFPITIYFIYVFNFSFLQYSMMEISHV